MGDAGPSSWTTTHEGNRKESVPKSYRTERAAENLAARLQAYGKNAYVYECVDCAFIPTRAQVVRWRDPETGERYSLSLPIQVIPAWHVGIDTGAPHHRNRTRCAIPDYSHEWYQEHGIEPSY